MRVLFINSFDTRGGAAIAARRLGKSIEKNYSAECFYLVGSKKSSGINTFSTRNLAGKAIEKIIDKISNKAGLQYQFFPFSSHTILKKIKTLKPDVISLHNTHGGYFPTPLIRKISQQVPIVWTLHDMWSFTGNAAHTFGDMAWINMKSPSHYKNIYPPIGINTGEMLLRQKQDIYRRARLTIVTPSRWLQNLAAQSPVFTGKQIAHVNNGIDLTVFRPADKSKIRAELGIPEDARVLLFSADHLKGNAWKGGKDLIQVLKNANEQTDETIHLIIIGKGAVDEIQKFTNFRTLQTGYIENEVSMVKYLSAADLFIYPTRADNLPNVLVEAIACGLPAITFNIGGCSEIIRPEYNGVIVEPFDYLAMSREIIRLLASRATLHLMSANGRKYAEENFSADEMAKKYMALFKEAIQIGNV